MADDSDAPPVQKRGRCVTTTRPIIRRCACRQARHVLRSWRRRPAAPQGWRWMPTTGPQPVHATASHTAHVQQWVAYALHAQDPQKRLEQPRPTHGCRRESAAAASADVVALHLPHTNKSQSAVRALLMQARHVVLWHTAHLLHVLQRKHAAL